MKRIGILGGSFNPIHNGHIQIALAVKNELQLDKIWIIPTGRHPLKPLEELLDAGLRVLLIQKAIEDLPDFDISFTDLNTVKSCYTDELISRLQNEYSEDQFYFIMGADNIPQLPQWHNWKWLVDHANLVAVNRPDTDMNEIRKLDYFSKITFVSIPPIPISSTMIREYLKKGKSITGLVPEVIEKDVVAYYK
jgi:nicotinate-nucleotide adenylyltransferase